MDDAANLIEIEEFLPGLGESSRLGVGGHALVYQSEDPSLVLKFPLPASDMEARSRLVWEALVFHYLGPLPGVVRYFGYEPHLGSDKPPALRLELIDGATFYEYLCRYKKLSEVHTIEVGIQICQIVGELHQRGVVHRDLSLANLFFQASSGDIRLIDFGLSIVLNPDTNRYESFEPGKAGTRQHQAPEISDTWAGDPRVDIYSLGSVLRQMALGLDGNSPEETQGLHYKALRYLSESLSTVIQKCLSHDPKERYQNIEELKQALLFALAKLRLKQVAKWLSAPLVMVGALWVWFSLLSPELAPLPQTQPVPKMVVSEAVQPPPAPSSLPASAPVLTQAPIPVTPTKPTPKKAKQPPKPTPQPVASTPSPAEEKPKKKSLFDPANQGRPEFPEDARKRLGLAP